MKIESRELYKMAIKDRSTKVDWGLIQILVVFGFRTLPGNFECWINEIGNQIPETDFIIRLKYQRIVKKQRKCNGNAATDQGACIFSNLSIIRRFNNPLDHRKQQNHQFEWWKPKTVFHLSWFGRWTTLPRWWTTADRSPTRNTSMLWLDPGYRGEIPSNLPFYLFPTIPRIIVDN